MATSTLELAIDAKLVTIQLKQVMALLDHVPLRRARRLHRKLYRLMHGIELSECATRKRGHAFGRQGTAFRVHVAGLDALIADAMRATGKSGWCHGP
jgi:hypothetical protein